MNARADELSQRLLATVTPADAKSAQAGLSTSSVVCTLL